MCSSDLPTCHDKDKDKAFGPIKCLAPGHSSGQFRSRVQTNPLPMSHCHRLDRFVKIKRVNGCKHALQNVKLSKKIVTIW